MITIPLTVGFEEKRFAYMFIDGGYIRGRLQELGRNDILSSAEKYARFLRQFISRFRNISYVIGKVVVTRAYYYDAIVTVEDYPEEHRRQKEFFNKLQLNMSMCEVKLGDLVKTSRGYKQKGVDTLIAIDMITKAYLNHYDVAYLVAGDRDFVNVVKAVKSYTGKIVIGVYEPTSVSEELIRSFDLRLPVMKADLGRICSEIR